MVPAVAHPAHEPGVWALALAGRNVIACCEMRIVVVTWVAVTLVTLGGCSWVPGLVNAAALEHGCPSDRVRVVADDGNEMARTVQLDVCGSRRVYRDVGGARATVWVDTTPASAGGEAGAPGSTPEAWSDLQVQDLVRDLDPQIRSCTGGTAITLTIVLDDAGRIRSADGNSGPPAERECVVRVLRTVDLRGEGRERRVRMRVGGSSSISDSTVAPTDGPRVDVDLPTTVRAQIDAAGARVLACAGTAAVAVVATWSESGTVVMTLRGETDSAVNDCVQSAVGTIPVPTGTTSGHLLHSVAALSQR